MNGTSRSTRTQAWAWCTGKRAIDAWAGGLRLMTLADLFDAYLSSLHLRAKPDSLAQAKVHRGHLERHHGPGYDVVGLRLADVEAFTAARLERVSKGSVNGSLGFLRASLRYGIEAGLLEGMPCPIRKLKLLRKLPRVLAQAEVESLLAASHGSLRLAVSLAAKAGLRHQEILHLTRADIRLDDSNVVVAAKVGWSPKNHVERAVPLGRDLCTALGARLELGLLSEGCAWLFPCPGGDGPLRTLARPMRAALKRAALYSPGMGLHSLRRTWATNLLAVTDIETVRQLGGWADLTTVQRYLNSSDERKRDAIEALDNG